MSDSDEALRVSEERLRLATQSASVGILDYDVLADRGLWSAEVCRILGVPEGQLTSLAQALSFVYPDDETRIAAAMSAALDPRGTGAFSEEFRIRRADTGETRWVASTCQTFFEGEAGSRRPVRFTGITTDITARKDREHHETFLLMLTDALRPLGDPLDVQETAARLVGEHLRVNRVGYAEMDGADFVIRREYVSGVAPLAGRRPASTFSGIHDASSRGDTVVVSDVHTDPRFTERARAALKANDIAAFVGVMLMKDGRLVASFGANNATARQWTRDDIALIREVAERTWHAVERASAETALREREQRLRIALDASAGGSWTWEAAGGHIDWDDGFRARYGFALDEPPTFDAWLGRVHDDDRGQVVGLLDEIMRTPGRDAWDNTFRIVGLDGTVSWIQSLGRATRDASGQVTRLTGLELDVTGRRRTEEEHQALREEAHNRQLRLLLETATQGIVSVNARGAIVMANHALEAMFGWAHGELVGESIERLVPAVAQQLHVRHRTEYFATPHAGPMSVGANLSGQRKDGSTFPIEVSLNHIVTKDGGQAIAFVTDITARRQAETVLRERTAQLSRLASDLTLAEQHAREQLAKTLHDGLQQMLVSAGLYLERHLKRGTHDAAGADLLAQAKRQIDDASAAARTLSLELFPPVLHGSGLPDALVWLADSTHTEYGLKVKVSVDPLADSNRKDVRTLLFESVRELLFNAVKHARVDRVTLDLSLDADNRLRITIADQGVGFDPTQLADRSKTGDAGLGLFSISERLTLLGGRFDIESEPGRGTTFRLIAPRGGPAAGARAAAGPLRILLVDDHATVRSVFRELLEDQPEFQVVDEAANGLEAIDAARALQPDVILMDISMPEMDGVEATRRIRAEFPSIRILGLSTQTRGADPHAIETAGAAGFFCKGLDTKALIDHLLAIRALGLSGIERGDAPETAPNRRLGLEEAQ